MLDMVPGYFLSPLNELNSRQVRQRRQDKKTQKKGGEGRGGDSDTSQAHTAQCHTKQKHNAPLAILSRSRLRKKRTETNTDKSSLLSTPILHSRYCNEKMKICWSESVDLNTKNKCKPCQPNCVDGTIQLHEGHAASPERYFKQRDAENKNKTRQSER